MREPVRLLSATKVASLPPGVQISLSPSSNGDSEYAQMPGLPPKSLCRFLCQTTFAVPRATQAKSPSEPRAYKNSPSTVGVERAAGNLGCCSGLPTLPRRADQALLPSPTAKASTNSFSKPSL